METKFPHLFAINIDELQNVKIDKKHIWGYEVWLVNDKELDIGTKLLVIYPGFVSSIHKHETKHEYFQVLSGELKLHIWHRHDKSEPHEDDHEIYTLESGKQHFVPKQTYHRFETGTKQFVLLLEMSTFEDEKTHKSEKAREL